MKLIHFKITTPEKIVYENDIVQLSVPTTTGEITILPNHIPLISILQSGELKLKTASGEEQVMAVAGGFLEVRNNNEVVILADNAEVAEQIDIDRAERARAKAIEEMASKNREDVDYTKLQAVIEREMNRVKIGKKYRKIKVENQ